MLVASGWNARVQGFAALLLVAALADGQQPPRRPHASLLLLDGTTVPFQALQIAAEKLSGEGLPASLTLDDLQKIELPAPRAAAEAPVAIAEFRGGGQIRATGVTIEKEKCRVTWDGGEPLLVPLDAVRALRLQPATSISEFDKSLAAPSVEHDRVFVVDDSGQISSIRGLVDSLTDEQLIVEINGQKNPIRRSRIYGIVVAQPATAEAPPRILAVFRDGSQLGGDLLELAAGKAMLRLPSSGLAQFAWDRVASVRVRSRRVAFLSELKPAAEEQEPIVTPPLPVRRNKSVSGQPLTLGTRIFESGLGVHARSRLTFSIEQKWNVFAATIGLDAASGGKGDCIFTVLADGQSLFSRRMRGSDEPYELRVPVAGRSELTLLVEPGEDLDLADHADWCDARLIK